MVTNILLTRVAFLPCLDKRLHIGQQISAACDGTGRRGGLDKAQQPVNWLLPPSWVGFVCVGLHVASCQKRENKQQTT
jgi:hypothetical protein